MATVGSRCVLCIGGFAIVRHLMSKHKKAQIPLSDMSESPPQAIEDGACTGITIERMKKLLLLGLPLSLSMLLEDGQLQFIAILAARIGKISIATHNSMLNFVWVLTSMMWAVSGATRVRVAFYLGAGNVEGAKRVIKIASVCGGGSGPLIALTFIVLRVEIGHLFSNDPLVWHLATKISTLCGLGYLALVIFYINMATLGAQGRPMAIALSFVLGAWVCCIPLAFFFAFHLEQTKGLFGLWLALAFGYGITTTLSSLYVWKSDWAGIVRRVQNDAEVNNTTINHDNQEYVPLESGDDERHGRYGST
jgi:Na+-driven multidrug efflux pump